MNSVGFDEIMDAFFGGMPSKEGLRVRDDGHIGFTYRGELECRKHLAQLARAYGWQVEEEVVVPGWGRIDIVLRERSDSKPRLIELKLDLTKPAKVRRAFQQADGYGRWWTRNKGEACDAVLIGCTVDRDVVVPVAGAYPEVAFGDVGQLMYSLSIWDWPSLHRLTAARRRAEELRAQLAVHEKAVANLNSLDKSETPS